MRVDLHVHSIFSDSSRSPEEIVQIAIKNDVSILSICDHYSIDAYDRIIMACSQHHIQTVLGVELDANWNNENFHVLAYNFDKKNDKMVDFIHSQHSKSQAECEQVVIGMSSDYPCMSLEDYKLYNCHHEKGGWKYMHYAVEKGAVQTYEQASYFFGKYFKPDPNTFPLNEFCEIVKKANGVPILAHPGYIYNNDMDKFIGVLKSMLDSGISGIECYYPSHSKEVTEKCVEFCRKNNLCITGGCDCHGDYDKSEGFTVGYLDINKNMLDLKGIL